jgi:hypothetical protein
LTFAAKAVIFQPAMRFTLPKLFLVVTLAALACAGLTLRTRLWAESIFTGTVVLFLVTGLLAVGRSGRVRVSSLAFAFFGGGYLLLVMCSEFSPVRDLLLTNRALVFVGEAMQISTQAPPVTVALSSYTVTAPNGTQIVTQATSPMSGTGVGSGTLTLSNSWTGSSFSVDDWNVAFGFGIQLPNPLIPAGAFLIIGHCVWSWLAGLLAGWFCGAMWWRSVKSTADSPASH